MAGEPGAIDNDALGELRQQQGELGERYTTSQHLIRRDAHSAHWPLTSRRRSWRWHPWRAPAAAHGRAIDGRRPESCTELFIIAGNHERVDRQLAVLTMRAQLEA